MQKEEFFDAEVYLYVKNETSNKPIRRRVIVSTSGEIERDGKLWKGWFAATRKPCEVNLDDWGVLTLESGKEYSMRIDGFEEIEDCDEEVAVIFTGNAMYRSTQS